MYFMVYIKVYENTNNKLGKITIKKLRNKWKNEEAYSSYTLKITFDDCCDKKYHEHHITYIKPIYRNISEESSLNVYTNSPSADIAMPSNAYILTKIYVDDISEIGFYASLILYPTIKLKHFVNNELIDKSFLNSYEGFEYINKDINKLNDEPNNFYFQVGQKDNLACIQIQLQKVLGFWYDRTNKKTGEYYHYVLRNIYLNINEIKLFEIFPELNNILVNKINENNN